MDEITTYNREGQFTCELSFFDELYANVHEMRDRGDTLLLHDCCRAEQCPCRNKQDIAEHALLHFIENIAAQHRSTAAAPRAARVYVLAFVEDHHTAIAVLFPEIDPFLG